MKLWNKFLYLIILLSIVGYSFFIEPNKLEVKHYSIPDNELKGIKIVFAADFHIKPHQKKRLQEIVQLINEQNPDIVLSAGDFMSGHINFLTMPIKDISQEFKNLRAPFYTSLGNHDQYFGIEYIKNELEKNGIKVLHNSNIKVNIKRKDIYIAGIQYKPQNMVPVIASLKDTNAPVIMLTHSPDEIKKIPDSVNLILAGHTHGGQVVIPLLGPIVTSSAYRDKYAYGLIEEDNKKMIVTRGIGVSILPFRFNCVPEIVVIEFV